MEEQKIGDETQFMIRLLTDENFRKEVGNDIDGAIKNAGFKMSDAFTKRIKDFEESPDTPKITELGHAKINDMGNWVKKDDPVGYW